MYAVNLIGKSLESKKNIAEDKYRRGNYLLCINTTVSEERRMCLDELLVNGLIKSKKKLRDYDFNNCDLFYVIYHKHEKYNIRTLYSLMSEIGELNSTTAISIRLKKALAKFTKFVPVSRQKFPLIRFCYLLFVFSSYGGDLTQRKIRKIIKELTAIIDQNQLTFLKKVLTDLSEIEDEDAGSKVSYNYMGCFSSEDNLDYQKQISLFQVLNQTNTREANQFDYKNIIHYYPTYIFDNFNTVLNSLNKDVDHYIILAHVSDNTAVKINFNGNVEIENISMNYLKEFFDEINSEIKRKNVLLLNCNFDSSLENLVNNYNLNVTYFSGNTPYITIEIFCVIYLTSLRKGFEETKAFNFAKQFSNLVYFPAYGDGWQQLSPT